MNISDHSCNGLEIKVFAKILEMKEAESAIKQTIVKMMNGRGGVILFNCEEKGLEVIARGEILT